MKDWIAINAVWPGKSHPRGATWDGHGVNFALFTVVTRNVTDFKHFGVQVLNPFLPARK